MTVVKLTACLVYGTQSRVCIYIVLGQLALISSYRPKYVIKIQVVH